MPSQYICVICKVSFIEKVELDQHSINCKPSDNKYQLISIFKSCLNIFRDQEALTGEKALRNLSYLLTLRLIEPQIGTEIIIDAPEFKQNIIDCYEYEFAEANWKTVLEVAHFSNLKKQKPENLMNRLKCLWDCVLAQHSATKTVFSKGKFFDVKSPNTLKKIIDKLMEIDLTNNEYDILGNSYEEVISDIMTGKVLGQFFTQPLVKKMMVKLINPQIFPDGSIETCCDPTMGTGGFLITCLNYLLNQAKEQNIIPDWSFIMDQGLYGQEIEPDTYQLAVSNLLISSGHMFHKLKHGDSIRQQIERKFDIVLANPPFGIQGMNYDEFQNGIKQQYVPIKSKNAVSLFIQVVIHILNINGRCAIVLPNGQELFSKTNKSHVTVREYLMKTCDLKEIIHLPSGIFTYTSIKTCIFHFIKKKEGSEAMQTTVKPKTRTHKFCTTHQTEKVQFYDYNFENDQKTLLVEVPINKIAENKYSLNYAEYVEEQKQQSNIEGIQMKTLGEVCKFKNGKSIKKDALIKGEYPVIGGGKNPMGFHNEFNTDQQTILCSSSGAYSGFINKYEKKVWASDCFAIIPNNNLVNNTYLYYLLKNIQDQIYRLQTGTAQPHVYSKDISNIQIPIPSLEIQNEIVEYLEYNDVLIKQLEKEIENNKQQAKMFLQSALGMNFKQSGSSQKSETASSYDEEESKESF